MAANKQMTFALPEPVAAGSEGAGFCSACGAPARMGDRFCRTCSAARQ